MTLEAVLIWLVIGAIAGWLAGVIVKGYGFGLVGNIVVGIIGAFLGGFIFDLLDVGVSYGIVGAIFAATIGAVVLLLLLRVLRRTGAA